jgi:hypothetical protein
MMPHAEFGSAGVLGPLNLKGIFKWNSNKKNGIRIEMFCLNTEEFRQISKKIRGPVIYPALGPSRVPLI